MCGPQRTCWQNALHWTHWRWQAHRVEPSFVVTPLLAPPRSVSAILDHDEGGMLPTTSQERRRRNPRGPSGIAGSIALRLHPPEPPTTIRGWNGQNYAADIRWGQMQCWWGGTEAVHVFRAWHVIVRFCV